MEKFILKLTVISIVSVVGLFVSCSDDNGANKNMEPLNINLTRSEAQTMKAVNGFTFKLMRKIEEDRKETGKNPNFVISPQGAAWCLAMVANGVEPGSESERELVDFFGFENGETFQDLNEYSEKMIDALTSPKTAGSIHIANAVFYVKWLGIYDDFLSTLKEFYNAKEFPNHTNSQIDQWVYEHTNRSIKNYGSDNKLEDYQFGVLNAIDFDAEWDTPFDPEYTKPREFRNEDGTISTPATMSENKGAHLYSDNICHALKIAMKNNVFAIHFMIPTEGHTISDVLKHLDCAVWDNITNDNSHGGIYLVRLPKFKLTESVDLFEIAKKSGLKSFITGEHLTGLFPDQSVFLMTRFQQTTAIELAENGVKASSATDFSGEFGAYLGNSRSFIMDEPFCFFITEESTGAILFAGKIGQL